LCLLDALSLTLPHSDLSFARDSSIGSRVNSPRRRRCDSEVVN